MRPDPVAGLLAEVDRRLAASGPPGAILGAIEALEPLTVRLDSGQVLQPAAGSYTLAEVPLTVGGRVIAIPLQRGHDWFIVSTDPV